MSRRSLNSQPAAAPGPADQAGPRPVVRFKPLLDKALALVAVLIIAFAVLTVAVRLALPHADGLRTQITERLGQFLGVQLEVGRLALRLRGLAPELTLADTVLRDPVNGEFLLGMRELRIDLDLTASLRALEPRIDGVTLVGARIEVRRNAEGEIRVRGLDAMHGGGGTGALTFFLREGRFSLADSVVFWSDAYAAAPTLRFEVRGLDLINRDRHHLLRADAAPPGDAKGTLTLIADLTGPPRRPQVWSGQLYADWKGSNVARVLRGRLPAWLRLDTGALHLTTWDQVDKGRLVASLNRIRLDALSLRRTDDARRLSLGDLSALARWRADDDGGWSLEVADLMLFGTTLRPQRTDLSLHLLPLTAGGRRQLEGAIGDLPLPPLAATATFFAPMDALPETVADLVAGGVDGRLTGLDYQVELAPDAPKVEDWRLRGGLSGLGFGRPGASVAIAPVHGLDLDFDATPRAGSARVHASDLVLDLRPDLSEPTRVRRLAGLLHWQWMPAGSIHLWTTRLLVDTQDLQSVSRLSLCLHPSGASPYVNLHTHLLNASADAAAVHRYLPVSIMDPKLVDWLDHALVAGQIESGDLLLRGKLEDFPFDDHSGRFLVELRVHDGILDYQPPQQAVAVAGATLSSAERARDLGWPRLEELDATVRFDDRALVIDVDHGRMLESEVLAGEARLPNLWQPRYLTVTARGVGPLSDGMRVLTETPLSYQLGGIARAFQVSGPADIELKLGVPLSKGLEFQYDGTLSLNGEAAATVTDPGLRFDAINGRLRFANAGLSAEDVRAVVDRQPVRIAVDTQDAGAANARTEVGITGRTSVPDLARRAPSPLWQLASGELEWRVGVTLRNADVAAATPPIGLDFSSDLRGLVLSPPAPIGKTAGEARPLTASALFQNQWPVTLTARYGELGARVELSRGTDGSVRVARAAVAADGVPDALPERRGLQIGGKLPQLDLAPWLVWFGKSDDRLRAGSAGAAAPAQALPVLPSRLSVATLALGPLRLRDVDARFAPARDGGWSVRFDAAGNSGSVDLPAAGSDGTLAVRLQALDLKPLLDAPDKQVGKAADSPRGLGRLQLDIDALGYGGSALGRLRLATEPQPRGVRFSELSLSGPLLNVAGTGQWTLDATGYAESGIDLSLNSTDFGQLLRTFGDYGELSGAPFDGKLTLSWPGGPAQFSLLKARGTFDATLGAGRLLQVEPGVGRMLGVLNLTALRRRLSLDFSDVFEQGFGFDQISGQMVIGGGQARIGQLDILASTADIRVTGTTNLVNQTFDQNVRVTPKIGTGVALASALAGGPLVGAAVFLADKVAGDAVDKLISYEYRVTGPWKRPLIRRVSGGDGNWSVPDLFAEKVKPPAGAATAPAKGASRPAAGDGQSSESKAPRNDNPFLEGF